VETGPTRGEYHRGVPFTYSLQTAAPWSIGNVGVKKGRRGDEAGIHRGIKAMKIRGPSGRPNSVGGAAPGGGISNGAPAGKAGQPTVSTVESAPTDRVQLSSLVQVAAGDNTSTHVAKLSSLSATVSTGKYQVAAGVLSNSIIEASMQLSGGNYV
jgi:hypothetical protein